MGKTNVKEVNTVNCDKQQSSKSNIQAKKKIVYGREFVTNNLPSKMQTKLLIQLKYAENQKQK